METYQRDTQLVIESFLHHKLSFPACISALDAVLAEFMPRMTGDQITHLRVVMLANNEIVVNEMERRGAPEKPKSRLGGTKFKMGRREISILKFALQTNVIGGATEEEQFVLDSLVSAGYLTREDPWFLPANTRDRPTYRLTPSGLEIANSKS
jgi:hypothetical protein